MLKNRSTHTLLLVGLMLLALLVAACSPAEETEEPTEAPAVEEQAEEETEAEEAESEEEAEEAATEESESEEEAEEEAAAPVDSAAGMAELPDGCMVVILDDGNGRSTVTIGRNSPSASAPTPRSYRIGSSYEVGQIVENDDGLWYELYQNNRTQGFVLAEQVGLGEGCE